eukprot:TRINITY_DN2574_c0_g1_i1.p1 TRINITY_DN2574_c0_g1~~TRINITY_DN2574_c0_g1_i1.p1  ORF type:complete len:169 (-),score=41.35 TRINITY_DN2574_c0_g1_i1:23-466(-)
MSQEAKVLYSTVIDAPVSRVWAELRQFDKLPGLASVENVNSSSSTEVGCVRKIIVGSEHVVETLIEFSETDYVVGYEINQHSENLFPDPVFEYTGKLQLFEVTEGNKTFVHWSANWKGSEKWQATRESISNLFALIIGETDKAVKQQ